MGTSAILSRDRKGVSTNDRGASHTAQLGSSASLTNGKNFPFFAGNPDLYSSARKIEMRHIALTWQPNGCTGKVEVDCAIAPLGLSAIVFATSIADIFLKRNASTGADRREKMAQIVRPLAIYD